MTLTRTAVASELRVMRIVVGRRIADIAASGIALTRALTSGAAASLQSAERSMQMIAKVFGERARSIGVSRS